MNKSRLPVPALALFASLLLLALHCDNTPTVPVPPPEMAYVYGPDAHGFVLVTGNADQDAEEDDLVHVYNADKEIGVIGRVDQDLTFEIEIRADVGDSLIVQTSRDDRLSDEKRCTVPTSGSQECQESYE